MLNFERPKNFAFKPTITVKTVPEEVNHLQEAYKQLQSMNVDYSNYETPYLPSNTNSSSHSVATSTAVYL